MSDILSKIPERIFRISSSSGRRIAAEGSAASRELRQRIVEAISWKNPLSRNLERAKFRPGTDPLTDRWTAAIGEPGWFSGSASELAAMARAVRAVLPSDVKLMVSGWAWQAKEDQIGPANSVVRYAAAPDGDGGFGRDHVQAISVHLYTYNNDPNAAIEELRSYERIFDQCGYSKALPRFVTEAGAWYPGIYTTDWPSVEDKARNMKRWFMIPAAFGYRGVYLYKHSEVGPMGDPARVPEVSAAIAEMRNGLRGKTLTQAAVLEDDSIWLMFADGSELRA